MVGQSIAADTTVAANGGQSIAADTTKAANGGAVYCSWYHKSSQWWDSLLQLITQRQPMVGQSAAAYNPKAANGGDVCCSWYH